MNTAKIIEKVNTIKNDIDKECISTALANIDVLLKELQQDLLRECAKNTGRLSAKKAADRIFKQLKEVKRNYGAYVLDGKQIIGGMCSCVRLKEHIPLEMFPEDTTTLLPYDKALTSASDNAGATLELPTLAELMTYCKTQKAITNKYTTILYDFGDNLPAVNAEYLIDILTLLGDTTAATVSARRPTVSVIYFSNDKGDDGILLPVMKRG